ncbi:uncharacterized protein ACBR49_001086 isoform 2-T3 [Aulostomus maculatus]
MKFTRDICRLLGLGGDGPVDEDVDIQTRPAALSNRRKDSVNVCPQVPLSSEEGLDDDKLRRKSERRRAKRKRQKERKKLEREERVEDASEQDEESDGEDEEWTAVGPRNKCSPESVAAFRTAGNKSDCQMAHRSSEEAQIAPEPDRLQEPEWDVSCAFVANAASHIKVKGLKTRALQNSRENKENEEKSGKVEDSEETKRRGEALTAQGIEMFEQGLYSQAVDMFTEAINCDPKDHRFYGNRSYCYWFQDQYSAALADAQRSIQLAPDWPKGYFRRGCALMGLKRYVEAEKAMEEVLKLDQHCKEASVRLSTCRNLQLMELGYEEEQSELLLKKVVTVQAVLASSGAKALRQTCEQDQTGSCRSLWVGNITLDVSEKNLLDLFKTFGDIESVRVLHERFCAFINFKNANMAAKALEKLQGVELGGNKLVMRYPDRWIQRTPVSTQKILSVTEAGGQQTSAAAGYQTTSRHRLPVHGDECFYWRTTGCLYGDKCRFKHVPEQQGRDKKR